MPQHDSMTGGRGLARISLVSKWNERSTEKEEFAFGRTGGGVGGNYNYVESHTEQTNVFVVFRAFERCCRTRDNRDLKDRVQLWERDKKQVTVKKTSHMLFLRDTWFLFHSLDFLISRIQLPSIWTLLRLDFEKSNNKVAFIVIALKNVQRYWIRVDRRVEGSSTRVGWFSSANATKASRASWQGPALQTPISWCPTYTQTLMVKRAPGKKGSERNQWHKKQSRSAVVQYIRQSTEILHTVEFKTWPG